jgi:hypothetical protein
MPLAPRIPIAKPVVGGRSGAPPRALSNPIKGSFDDPAGPSIGIGIGSGNAPVLGGMPPPGKRTGPMARGGISKSSLRRAKTPKL